MAAQSSVTKTSRSSSGLVSVLTDRFNGRGANLGPCQALSGANDTGQMKDPPFHLAPTSPTVSSVYSAYLTKPPAGI